MQKEKIKEPDLTRWALFAPPGAWLRITEIPFLSITEGETKKREQGGIGSAPRPIMVQGGSHFPSPHRLDIIKVIIRQRKTKEGHAQLRT